MTNQIFFCIFGFLKSKGDNKVKYMKIVIVSYLYDKRSFSLVISVQIGIGIHKCLLMSCWTMICLALQTSDGYRRIYPVRISTVYDSFCEFVNQIGIQS